MPYTETFDTLHPEWTGTFGGVTIRDVDKTPNKILDINKNWAITLELKLASTANDLDMLSGSWEVKAVVESIGKGYEGDVGTKTLDFQKDAAAGSTPYLYKWPITLDVAAGIIDTPGTYKLVVLALVKGPTGNAKEMAGFIEGPLLTFYKEK